MSGICGGQNRALDLLELEFQVVVMPYGVWELILGPLREYPVFLTTESFLQLSDFKLYFCFFDAHSWPSS